MFVCVVFSPTPVEPCATQRVELASSDDDGGPSFQRFFLRFGLAVDLAALPTLPSPERALAANFARAAFAFFVSAMRCLFYRAGSTGGGPRWPFASRAARDRVAVSYSACCVRHSTRKPPDRDGGA